MSVFPTTQPASSLAPKPVALITGGAKRLGKAIVQELSTHFRLAVHFYRSTEDAHSLVATLPQATLFQSDLTHPSAPNQLVQNVCQTMGNLHLIVNNAALFYNDSVDLLKLAKMKTLNFDAPRKLIAAARPHLAETHGQIINIADIAGIRTFQKYKAYSKSKSALIELSIAEALSLAREQIRINTICPGIVLPSSTQKADAVDQLQREIPLNRIGKPEDIAQLVKFLATSDFITGQVIAVDGGRLLNPKPKTVPAL